MCSSLKDLESMATLMNCSSNLQALSVKCEVVTGDEFTALLSYVAKHNLSNAKMYLLSRTMDEENCWKEEPTWSLPSAHIIPVFKQGKTEQVTNYQPISLTWLLVNILETLVYNYISAFIESSNLLSVTNLVFVLASRAQLSLFIHFMCELDKHHSSNAIFLDFEKAFNSIPHSLLLQQRESFGITDLLLHWLSDFLSDRFQHVMIDDYNLFGRLFYLGLNREVFWELSYYFIRE